MIFSFNMLSPFFLGKLVCGMSNLPEAAPLPDGPRLHLTGGCLLVASPADFSEACFSVPAIRALKRFRPMGTLAVLCPESLKSLWGSVPQVDALIVYPDQCPTRKIVPLLKDGELKFDSAILWEAGGASKAIARAGVPQRLGYPVKGLVKLLTDPVERILEPGPIEHRVRYYLGLVQELGGDAFVRENFQTSSVLKTPENLRVALARYSEYGPSYEWPEEKFDQLKLAVEEKHGAIEWVEVSGEDDVAEVLASCSALLACDGEVAHWAAHIGLPAVVIFGPNESEWKRPLGKQSRVVRERVACSPCYLAKCPLDHRCQNEVSVEAVVGQLDAVFAGR